MAGEIVQRIDLQWDSKSADHALSDFSKKVVKTFNDMHFDPVKQFNEDLQKASKNVDEISQKLDKVKGTKLHIDADPKELEDTLQQIHSLEDRLHGLQKQQELGTISKTNAAWLDKTKKELDDLTNKYKELKAGTDVAAEQSEEFMQLSAELERQESIVNSLTGSFESLADSMTAEELETSIAYLQEHENEIEGASDQLKILRAALINVKNAENDAGEATEKLNTHLKNTSEHAQKSGRSFNLSFGHLLRYALGIRSLYTLFSRLRSAAKEGLGYVIAYSSSTKASVDQITRSFNQMKAAAGAAISPLAQAIAPVIARLAQLFTVAANAAARFFAILTGRKTVVQASLNNKSFAASAKGAGKAAKDAAKDVNKALAPFDDLNVLTEETADNLDDMSGGMDLPFGGEGAAFTTIELDPTEFEFLNKLREWIDSLNLEPLREAWERFTNVLERFFGILRDLGYWIFENVLFPLGTWLIEKGIPDILNVISGILELLCDVLESLGRLLEPLWTNVLQPLFKALGDFVDNTLKWLAEKLEEAHEWIEKNKDSFDAWIGTILLLAAVLLPMIAILKHIADGTKETGGAADSASGGIFNLAGGFGTLLSALGKAAVIASVGFLLEGLAKVIESLTGLVQALNEAGWNAWNLLGVLLAVLIPIALAITAVVLAATPMALAFVEIGLALIPLSITLPIIAEAISKISDAITNLIARPLQTLMEFLDKLKENVSIMKADVPVLVGLVTQLLTAYRDAITQMKTLSDEFIQKLKRLLEEYKLFIKEVKEQNRQLLENIKKFLEDVIKFVDKTKKTIKDRLDELSENVATAAKDFRKAFEEMAQAVSDAADAIASTPIVPVVDTSSVDAAIGKLNTLLSLMAEAGSASVSISSNISGGMRIPHLASGGVLPPNQPFLAMLGDQKKGTNVEAPLETITAAMIDALRTVNYSGGNEVILNVDGVALARTLIPHDLKELDRQGYNVAVLEGK